MTQSEIKAHLDLVVYYYRALTKQLDALGRIIGSCPESPLSRAIWKTFDAYVETTSLLVGDASKSDSWLSWYIWDNECGKRKMEATVDGVTYKVTGTKVLAKVIQHWGELK